MKVSLLKGTTSYLARIFIQDSSSTTGAGLAGLTSGSSGLVCYRARDDDGNAAGTQITLSAGTRGTWSSGGFVEKDASNMPGVYELGITNASLVTGSKSVLIMLKGATNMAPLALEIELTGWDNQDGVRGGLTALPNAAAEAAGGIFTRGTGAGQINQEANGYISVNLKAILGTVLTETAGLLAGGFKKFFNVASPTLTCLGIDQTGDSYARIGAPAGASISADIATVGGYIDTEVAAILAAVDTEVAAILALLNSARSEPAQGAPPVNPNMATKVDYLYKSWRNKKDNDGSTTKLYADDASTVDHKQTTSSSGGTVTKGEWATGP